MMDYWSFFIQWTVVLLVLISSHVSSYFNQSYGKYKFLMPNNISLPFYDAYIWCRDEVSGYDLAIIPESDAQTKLEVFLKEAVDAEIVKKSDQVFVGGKLINPDSSWYWLNKKQVLGFSIEDQTILSNMFWYGYLNTSNYRIHASKPTAQRPYICEFGGVNGTCEGGLALGTSCYKSFETSVPWFEARNDCLGKDGDLASFATLNDSTIQSTLNGSSMRLTAEYWIGVQRTKWTWNREACEVRYTNWEPGRPSTYFQQTCICLRNVTNETVDRRWMECNCVEVNGYPFVCMEKLNDSYCNIIDTTTITVLQSTSDASSSNKLALAIGLGVGLGVGVILIIVVVVVVVVVVMRRRNQKNNDDERSDASYSDEQSNNAGKEAAIDEDLQADENTKREDIIETPSIPHEQSIYEQAILPKTEDATEPVYAEPVDVANETDETVYYNLNQEVATKL